MKKVDSKMDLPQLEKNILEFWKNENIFRESLKLRESGPSYSFYDGPPFATGTPHYGHIVASIMKDVVPRYYSMKGYNVPRVWGWDCHGLPIENIAEKELGLKNKKDIEEIGIERFNEFCRSKVMQYADEWKVVIERLGRWADMDNPYKTMDLAYMESVWWVFKQLWDKGLIYESYRSMHICPRCETTLSQSEVAEGYKDVKDLSVVAKFSLVDEPDTSILAWTTTPWTLIGNVALAVGAEIKYVKIEKKDQESGEIIHFVLAKDRLKDVFKEDEYKIVAEMPGVDLVGKQYVPLFDYYANDNNLKNVENGWKVYAAPFVTTEEGTGVVHIAPAFGEDDMNLGKENNLPFVQHVGMDGIIRSEAGEFAGMHVKPADDVQRTDVEIIKYLAKIGKLFDKEKYEHSYPHCWRCDTPLLNYATSSWFVSVEKIKPQALELAKQINWSPAHMKNGRFGKWLEGARDWSISRQRFWASCIPIWKCDCGETRVFDSLEELRKSSGQPITKIIFVRHGQSEKNLSDKIYTATRDKWPLTEKGQGHAEQVASRLGGGIDFIVSSPVLRARQTADIINKKLNLDLIEDDLVSEIEFGEWTDLTEDERKQLQSYRDFKAIKSDPDKRYEFRLGVTGETRDDVIKRTEEFIRKILKEHPGKTILVVGHGGFYPSLSKILHNISNDEFFKYLPDDEHETIYEFYLTEDGKSFDLHKDKLDKITLACDKCQGEMKRIPDVIDTWFDSGSMPYAQGHYPFENKERFEESFPAEFIGEGVDQTRAWFYYLHVIGTAIFNKPAFKNVTVNGIVLAEDGKKMAKRLKNYPDPMEMLDKYGADVMRYYLLTSPVMAAENLNFSEKEMVQVSRGVFRMLWNSYSFFAMYAELDDWKGDWKEFRVGENILDRWIISKLENMNAEIEKHMKKYDLVKASRVFAEFLDNLSNWYIRRNRKRFWRAENDGDKNVAFATLNYLLVKTSQLLAPFCPFLSEEIFKNLTGEKSVHLCDYPAAVSPWIDKQLEEEMQTARELIEAILALRDKSGIKVRQPLASVEYLGIKLSQELEAIIAEEVNVKLVGHTDKLSLPGGDEKAALDTQITDELKLEGLSRELIRETQVARKELGFDVSDRIALGYATESEMLKRVFVSFASEISNEVLASELKSQEEGELKKQISIDGQAVTLYLEKARHA